MINDTFVSRAVFDFLQVGLQFYEFLCMVFKIHPVCRFCIYLCIDMRVESSIPVLVQLMR